METGKRKRLQNISIWITIAALGINQCNQSYLNYLDHKKFRTNETEIVRFLIEVEERDAQFLKDVHQILQSLQRKLQYSQETVRYLP